MSSNYKYLYEDTDSIKIKYPLTEEARRWYAKCFLNAQYGTMVTNYKENDMRTNDFIVLHSDGMPVMVKKEAIAVLSKLSDGSARVDAGNQIWITDDKYNDVVRRLFE